MRRKLTVIMDDPNDDGFDEADAAEFTHIIEDDYGVTVVNINIEDLKEEDETNRP